MDLVFDLLFRPLARLAMARGLRFADVAERLRRAYFDMAVEEAGAGATDSKLSVMTGLQRRDIARLRAEEDMPEAAPDPLARLVAQWLAVSDGAPLPRHGEGSFDTLAREIRRDIHPRTMLDALIAAGTVSASRDQVMLKRRAHIPQVGSEAQLAYLARNVGDHLQVSVSNVMGGPAGHDMAVHYGGLSDDAAAALEAAWRARLTPVLEEMNEMAAKLQQDAPGTCRIRGGSYFFKGDDT